MYKLLSSDRGHITVNLALLDLEDKINAFEKDGFKAIEHAHVIKVKEGLFSAYITMYKD